MNARMLTAALFITSSVAFGPLGLSETRDTVTAPVDKVLVPTGLTSRHRVELTLTGVFPNSCYAVNTLTADVDQEAKFIRITAEATEPAPSDDVMCAQVLTRFIEPVVIGPLTAGTYTIFVVDRPEAEVEPLVISVDDDDTHGEITYAPVERALVTRTDAGDPLIEIAGRYPYTLIGCLTMTEIITAREPGDVIQVEPFAEYTDGDRCRGQEENKAFAAVATVSEPLEPGVYLIQVKTFGGDQIQRIAVID